MNVNFVKVSPTQNMTILVKDVADRNLYKSISSKLLRYDSIYGEQVGFIEGTENNAAWARLQMMGGEFCGNATMSLAALLVRNKGLRAGEIVTVPLEVSGISGLLGCEVIVQEQSYLCKVEMPTPKEITKITLDISGQLMEANSVCLPGISHVIVETGGDSIDKNAFVEAALPQLLSQTSEEALGILFFDPTTNYMLPVVHVKNIGLTVWERGCGSGTAALGAYIANYSGRDLELTISQPGGEITVFVKWEHKAAKVWIQGEVRIVAEGVAYL